MSPAEIFKLTGIFDCHYYLIAGAALLPAPMRTCKTEPNSRIYLTKLIEFRNLLNLAKLVPGLLP